MVTVTQRGSAPADRRGATAVAPLAAFGRGDLDRAGGKGANLGELIRGGFGVPDGFVITTAGYESVAATVRPVPSGDAAGQPAAIRGRFEAATIPQPLAGAITAAYRELGGGPVAVRSSATAEDLPGAAFAGQQDTYLDVVGEEALLDAVRRCWGSLWTDRAVAYRRHRGLDQAEPRLAVVVQRMVDADLAGVMFTANPVTGAREEVVVDAYTGLGEAVVSGAVTPDHYRLDHAGTLIQWRPGQREPGQREAGPDAAAGVEPLLTPVRLRELARVGRAVAAHFGAAQDIEWCLADDRLWLVQARPMTALPPPPLRLSRARRRAAAMLLEYLPYRPYPIDVTTWLPYGPAGLMLGVVNRFGIRLRYDGMLPEVDGVVSRLVPPTPRPGVGLLWTPVRLLYRSWRHDPARWREDPRFVEVTARIGELAATDPAGLAWPRLTRLPRQALAVAAPVADLRLDYLPRAGWAYLRLRVALALLRRGSAMGGLLAGVPTRTAAANAALRELAAQVRAEPRLRAAVASGEPERLVDLPAFRRGFEAFLAEYGHRETATAVLATSPTQGESPGSVLAQVALLAAGEPAGTAEPAATPASAMPASTAPASTAPMDAQRVAAVLRHPLLRWAPVRDRVGRWVAAVRAGLVLREDSHAYLTMPLPPLRAALLEVGARLVTAGVASRAEDVYHLRLAEIESATDPARMPAGERERLRATIAARVAARAALDGVPLIDPASVFATEPAGEALVSGTPASAGTATGRVVVVTSVADFSKLDAGDVLVCPFTNPAWTPLFERAAAVVVDTGSAASHAAIVAREYGIPAVMGTGNGTRLLADGQRVTVDGSRGRVTAAGA